MILLNWEFTVENNGSRDRILRSGGTYNTACKIDEDRKF